MLVAKWQEYRELAFHDCAKRIIIDDNRLLVEACKDRHGLLLQLTVKIVCILPPKTTNPYLCEPYQALFCDACWKLPTSLRFEEPRSQQKGRIISGPKLFLKTLPIFFQLY